MKHARLWVALGTVGLLAGAGWVALSRAQEAGDRGFSSDSYLITNKVSGTFFSRGVITLHADHTMSVIDSAQGGQDILLHQPTGLVEMGRQGQDRGENDRLRLPARRGCGALGFHP